MSTEQSEPLWKIREREARERDNAARAERLRIVQAPFVGERSRA
jgi:hypothetical protein